jgi:phosphoglycerol transferase MdoB-like AlkP superfamily enzyme
LQICDVTSTDVKSNEIGLATREQPCFGTWREIALALLAVSAIIMALTYTLLDSVLLQKSYGYFGGTAMNKPFALHGAAEYGAFLLGSLIYDFISYFVLIAVVVLGLRKFLMPRLSPLQHLFVAVMLIGGIVLAITAAKYRIAEYWGDTFNLAALKEIAGGHVTNALAWISGDALLGLIAVPVLALILVMSVIWIGPLGANVRPWRPTWRAMLAVFIGIAVLVLLQVQLVPHPALRHGLSVKVSYRVVDAGLRLAFDYDRNPVLEAGLESVRTATARDIDRARAEAPPDVKIVHSNGMNVFIIVIETFRSDMVAMSIAGEPVMPFFNALTRTNASTDFAVSNYGVTARAIQTVMSGSVHYDRGSDFLPDQLRRLGYHLYAVSAQDESFGDTRQLLGMDRYDSFYDASMKQWDRNSLSTWQRLNPLSLTLDSEETNSKIFETLDHAQPPFFFYVNFQDLHYPYFGPHTPLHFIKEGHTDSGFFTPDHAAAIKLQYANAAYHLDASLQAFLNGLESRGLLRNSLIVIVGDHPDSIYENGLLGHGWAVDEAQRRTPLLVINGKGHATAPLGQDEILRIVHDSLQPDAAAPPLEITFDRGKQVFEIGGPLDNPRQLALLAPDRLFTYDALTNLVRTRNDQAWLRPGRLSEASEPARAFQKLIGMWRAELLLQRASANPAVPAVRPPSAD